MTPTIVPTPGFSAAMFGDRVRYCPSAQGRDNRARFLPPTGPVLACRIARINARTMSIGEGGDWAETTYEVSFPGRQDATPGDQYARIARDGTEVGPRLNVTSGPLPHDADETHWVCYATTVE